MDAPKLFIVEDEPIEAMDLRQILERLGYLVVGIASSGEECLEMATSVKPDLIIMDIKLGGAMDGIDTAWELRKISDAPVIFATALSDNASLMRAKLIGPYGYITKPYNERELHSSLETSLYRYRIDTLLRESESKYRALFEQSRDAIFIAARDGAITNVNRAMIETTGYDAAELTCMNIRDLFCGEGEAGRFLGEMEERGHSESAAVSIGKRDGTAADCQLSLARIVSGIGGDYVCQGIIRDVTGQLRLERVRDALFHDKIRRVKELNFLFGLAQASGSVQTSLDDIFRHLVDTLPAAFPSPAAVSARISGGCGEFKSPKFRNSRVGISAPVKVFGNAEWTIEVFHHGTSSEGEEFFPKEARDLVDAAAERMGILIERKRTYDDLSSSRQELRGLAARLQSLREAERTGIAREIHDVLGQSLTALKMDAALIRKKLLPGQEDLAARANAMAGLVDGIIDQVRRMASDLRPGVLDDLGLVAAIEWYAGEFRKRTGIPCRLSYNTEDLGLDEAQAVSMYRIAQESLTNIIRHADATEVSITINRSGNALSLSVADNGRGINEDRINSQHSLGLIGMRERVFSCGGTIMIRGGEGGGTIVKAEIPVGGDA